jgi:hypothetical protein
MSDAPEAMLETMGSIREEAILNGIHSIRSINAKRFVDAARETGDYAGELIRIDDERRENPTGDTDPDGLALDRWISVLNEACPGFEIALAGFFFRDKCGRCGHPQGQESAGGKAQCPLDFEFREYLLERLLAIVQKVRSGATLQAAVAEDEALQPYGGTVPEWVRRRYLKSEGRWQG